MRRCQLYYSDLDILLLLRKGDFFIFLLLVLDSLLQGCNSHTEAIDDGVLLGVVELHLVDMGAGIVQLLAGLVQHDVQVRGMMLQLGVWWYFHRLSH